MENDLLGKKYLLESGTGQMPYTNINHITKHV